MLKLKTILNCLLLAVVLAWVISQVPEPDHKTNFVEELGLH